MVNFFITETKKAAEKICMKKRELVIHEPTEHQKIQITKKRWSNKNK